MNALELVAPMKGWVASLEEVPDLVFAQRMLGDGLAIDPVGSTVHAPCNATVISVAHHAVTLRAPNGAEILIHIGLETVALHGQGFMRHVKEGASVQTGDPLLTFDMDFLARKAKSLISPIVITNGEDFRISRRSENREIEPGEFLMELESLGESGADDTQVSRDIVIPLPHGIHARPAAAIATAAKRFISDIEILARGRKVNAKSVAALMSLAIRNGESVTISARGSDGPAALNALADVILSDLKEELAVSTPSRTSPVPETISIPANALRGITGSPGIATGHAFRLRVSQFEVTKEGEGVAHETSALNDALERVRARISALAATGSAQQREILSAHLTLLDDPELKRSAQIAIESGKSAAFSWREAVSDFEQAFRAMDDLRMRERAGDFVDLERQVMAVLYNDEAATVVPPDAILIADELLPSELIGIGKLAGIVTAQGGPTSHVAIIAAAMGIPALVSTSRALEIEDGTPLILDADDGLLYLYPDSELTAEFEKKIAYRKSEEAHAYANAQSECRTADGTRVEIFANLGAGPEEAQSALNLGAEGCGLLRTEFLFLDRHAPPSEDEQVAAYQAIADILNGRPFKIRTFDIGGDKPVPYMTLPREENPALGLRGIRAGLWHKDILKTQLAAILRVKAPVRIMLPMITSLAELQTVRTMLNELRSERGIAVKPSLGIMVETPASAVLSAQMACEADFLSIGTNDLTQYVLAMDRTNAQLASEIDPFHPAVLSLISQIARAGNEHGCSVAVCGGMAGDPLAAALLVGLGVRELSMPARVIAQVKETIRGISLDTAREAAALALKQNSAAGARAAVKEYLNAS